MEVNSGGIAGLSVPNKWGGLFLFLQAHGRKGCFFHAKPQRFPAQIPPMAMASAILAYLLAYIDSFPAGAAGSRHSEEMSNSELPFVKHH